MSREPLERSGDMPIILAADHTQKMQKQLNMKRENVRQLNLQPPSDYVLPSHEDLVP
jgi:hypothetical protein